MLPAEIQAELEEATRRRQIKCLVATTTLTEGVNLPFKSVVIGTTGWGSTSQGTRHEVINTARLLSVPLHQVQHASAKVILTDYLA